MDHIVQVEFIDPGTNAVDYTHKFYYDGDGIYSVSTVDTVNSALKRDVDYKVKVKPYYQYKDVDHKFEIASSDSGDGDDQNVGLLKGKYNMNNVLFFDQCVRDFILSDQKIYLYSQQNPTITVKVDVSKVGRFSIDINYPQDENNVLRPWTVETLTIETDKNLEENVLHNVKSQTDVDNVRTYVIELPTYMPDSPVRHSDIKTYNLDFTVGYKKVDEDGNVVVKSIVQKRFKTLDIVSLYGADRISITRVSYRVYYPNIDVYYMVDRNGNENLDVGSNTRLQQQRQQKTSVLDNSLPQVYTPYYTTADYKSTLDSQGYRNNSNDNNWDAPSPLYRFCSGAPRAERVLAVYGKWVRVIERDDVVNWSLLCNEDINAHMTIWRKYIAPGFEPENGGGGILVLNPDKLDDLFAFCRWTDRRVWCYAICGVDGDHPSRSYNVWFPRVNDGNGNGRGRHTVSVNHYFSNLYECQLFAANCSNTTRCNWLTMQPTKNQDFSPGWALRTMLYTNVGNAVRGNRYQVTYPYESYVNNGVWEQVKNRYYNDINRNNYNDIGWINNVHGGEVDDFCTRRLVLIPREYTYISTYSLEKSTIRVSCKHATSSNRSYYLWYTGLSLPKQYIGTDRQVDKIYLDLTLSDYLTSVKMEYKFKFKTDSNQEGVVEVFDGYRTGSLSGSEVSLLDENNQLIYTNNDTYVDIYMVVHSVEGQVLPLDKNEILVKRVNIENNRYDGADGFYDNKLQNGNKIVDVKAAFELIDNQRDVENAKDGELLDIGKYNSYLYSGTAKHDPFTILLGEQGQILNS